jgi:homoserine O-acetyltransferase
MHSKTMTKNKLAGIALVLILCARASLAADWPAPKEGDFVIRDFRFRSGQTLPDLRLHYRTFGSPQRDAQGRVNNAVLILHGTTGSGTQFLRAEFAGELFGPGQLLDVSRYYLVIPDNIGHGQSSRPSDGLRAGFPKYSYHDMVAAQHRLLTEGLRVERLRLIIGTSMGGMHAWLWGETYPEFMDALMPLGCLPAQISGRNRAWRRVVIDAIRHDPQWNGGNYESQPPGLRTALGMIYVMSSNPVIRQKEAPTLAAADDSLDRYLAQRLRDADANDVLYAFEASRDYDPGPDLGKIKALVLAINFADDLINPPELGILEREIKRVPRLRAIVLPFSDRTQGHGTHTIAALWKNYLTELLAETDPQ